MAAAVKMKLDQKWGAWVFVKWKSGTPDNAWNMWKKSKQIEDGWSMAGEWDCMLWVDASSPMEVEKVVWKEIRANKWVEKTQTHWARKYW